MKRMLSFLALLIACLTTPTFTASPARADYEADEIEKSLVWVDIMFTAQMWAPKDWFTSNTSGYFVPEGEVSYGCSGWFASDSGDIVTAGHCVAMDDAVRRDLITDVYAKLDYSTDEYLEEAYAEWQVRKGQWMRRVLVGQPPGVEGTALDDDGIPAQVVDFQPFDNGDNALLRVADVESTPLTITEQQVETNDAVTAIGFAGSVTAVSDIKRQRASFKVGTVSSTQFTDNGVANIEIDAAVTGGMSGGPTINENGHVVGVNSFGITGENQPFNFVTETETLRRFLAGNGITLQTATSPGTNASQGGSPNTTNEQPASPSSAEEAPNTLVRILVGVIVVLSIALLVFGFLSHRKRRRPVIESPVAQATSKPLSGPPPSSPPPSSPPPPYST